MKDSNTFWDTPYSSPELGAPLDIMRSKLNCLTAYMFLVVIWLVDTRYELDLGCVDYHECIVWIPVGNIQFSPVQSLSHVHFFVTPWTTAHQASLSITNSQNLPKLMSIESVMTSNHLILCHPLLLLPSIFPSIRDFSNESDLCIRWPKY